MTKLSLTRLAIQNLRRKPYRAFAIGLCIAITTGSLFAVTILLRGVENSLTVGRARLGADIVVVPEGFEQSAQEIFITGQPTTFYMDDQTLNDIAMLPGVKQASSQVFINTLKNAKCCIGEFFLVGFDPQSDFTISPWLANKLSYDSIGPFNVIAGDRILLRQGDSATFYGTNFTVAGVLEKTGMGIDRTIYVPIAGLRTMIENSAVKAEQPLTISSNEISSVLVQVEPGTSVIDVAERIEDHLEGIQAFTASQLNQSVSDQLGGLLGVSLVVTGVLWLMSLLTIGLVFSMIVNERQRELGLMRAMGASRKHIFRLVMSEAVMLTGIGGLGGLVGAGGILIAFGQYVQMRLIHANNPINALSRLFQLKMNIPYLMPDFAEIMGIELLLLLMALTTGALASLQPALSSSRMEPYEAIRQGE